MSDKHWFVDAMDDKLQFVALTFNKLKFVVRPKLAIEIGSARRYFAFVASSGSKAARGRRVMTNTWSFEDLNEVFSNIL